MYYIGVAPFMPFKTLRYFRNHGAAATLNHSRYVLRRGALRYAFRASAKLGLKQFRTAYGVTMQANWADATFQYCSMGDYGQFLFDKLREKQPPFSFVDIGANQGLYSLIAAKNPSCRNVVSFEPVSGTYDLLLRNVALNVGHEKVQCHQKAISDTRGEVTITLSNNHSGGATMRTVELHPEQQLETIQCINDADVAKLIPADLPIIVKIDVEGHEKPVISQLIKLPQAARIEKIFYEVDEDWVDPLELQDLLKSIGIAKFEKIGDGRHYDIWACR